MLIQLDRLREKPFSWQEVLEIEPESLESSEVSALSPVEVRGVASYTHPGFLLRLWLDYEQTLACTRCLEPTREKVQEEVALVVLPGRGQEPEELELDEDDLNVVRVEGEEIDTDPLVLEQIQLQVPMKVLCDPECEGLCPRCGSPLREGECGCPEPPVDERWAELKALRDRLS